MRPDGDIEETIHAAGNVATRRAGDELSDRYLSGEERAKREYQPLYHREHIAPFYSAAERFLRDFKQNIIYEKPPNRAASGTPTLDVERYGNRKYTGSFCLREGTTCQKQTTTQKSIVPSLLRSREPHHGNTAGDNST
ncbi:hypothetical protein KCP74_12390 [Salmonella enterica subsp. enterica]|nr:hypothetical protein KCP74_12390 [Salmonella enterica subsp. enterica]